MEQGDSSLPTRCRARDPPYRRGGRTGWSPDVRPATIETVRSDDERAGDDRDGAGQPETRRPTRGRARPSARTSSAACRWAARRRSSGGTASGARRPSAPAARRRDRAAVGLDPVAVPGVQRAAAVRGRAARGGHATARCRSCGCATASASRTSCSTTSASPDAAIASYKVFAAAQARRRDPAARALPGLAADAAGAGQRVHRPRAPGGRSSRSTRPRAARSSPRSSPRAARPARAPVGHAARVRDARRASRPAWFGETRAGVLERLLRVSRHVPADVELGFHLCYGDDYHGHFTVPADAGKLVEVANALAAALYRPLNWIHLPGARRRPTRSTSRRCELLRLHPETELYLGVLHADDGTVGARRRIELRARLRAELRRGDRLRLGSRRLGRRRRAAGAPPGDLRPRRTCRRRSARVRLARRLRAHPRRGLDARAAQRVRPGLRPRRRARLVREPQPDRRAARRRTSATATSSSTTRAGPASWSTACGCGSSSARWA